jgi:Fe2+ transport system protein FeoA
MKAAPDSACVNLDRLPTGGQAVIGCNPDRKSREMGLAPGAQVRMLRNHRRDHAVVVAVADARFLVSRGIAAQITLGAS